jgi:hypothetical protein
MEHQHFSQSSELSPPATSSECVSPLGPKLGGTHSLAVGGMGGPKKRIGQKHWYSIKYKSLYAYRLIYWSNKTLRGRYTARVALLCFSKVSWMKNNRKVGQDHRGVQYTNSFSLTGGYSRHWHRAVVPARQPKCSPASRWDNPVPESTISHPIRD